ncbi:hypothetical protein J4231_02010, partial [Candidatus Woesearchaeota archaeon]|nr:hypothetical protein [Candidatus Woesearchaeota archaeon]
MKIIFWCEFPEQVDFNKLNSLIKFKTEIYFAANSIKEFKRIRKKIKNRNIKAGVWPVLEKKDGYWLSGFVARDKIDKLNEFDGLRVKIDVEPPIYKGKHSLLKDIAWFARYSIIRGKNNDYLREKILNLRIKPIMSGFLLPYFIRKRYGDLHASGTKNYICYTTFFPRAIRPLARLFYSMAIRRMERKRTFYGIGLTNNGIFENESAYENINEFKKDIEMMVKAGANNLCVYSIEGILKRKDAGKWLDLLMC